MEDEKYIKPRHRKLDKHYTIIINNKKVKILKYNINTYWDSYAKCKYEAIELITKISNKVFNNIKIEIKLEKDNKIIKITGVFHGSYCCRN